MTLSRSRQNALVLAGRALIALLFIPNGYEQLNAFAGTVGYIAAAGVPLPHAAGALSIAIHLGLGTMLLVGFQARWSALGLALFTFVISFIFHNYWSAPAAEAMMQQINFFKNLAIVGGLLGIVAWGPGDWSLDGRRARA